MNSLNLHAMVRGAISALHPEVKATLYQSVGQIVLADGSIKSRYAPGQPISVQMQSEGAEALFHSDRVGMEEENRKFYLFSESAPDRRVAGLVRALSRGGDMLQLEDGSWWLVEAILEDFTLSGWASVRAVLQVNPPQVNPPQVNPPQVNPPQVVHKN
jgi:hypothetical protein